MYSVGVVTHRIYNLVKVSVVSSDDTHRIHNLVKVSVSVVTTPTEYSVGVNLVKVSVVSSDDTHRYLHHSVVNSVGQSSVVTLTPTSCIFCGCLSTDTDIH